MRMRKILPSLALGGSLLAGGFMMPQSTSAQVYYGYNSYDNDLDAGDVLGAFLTAMVGHFGANEQNIYMIQDYGLHEREIPVALYLARQAGVSPMTIAQLRANGMSWSDITFHLGLGSDIYYVPLSSSYYGPYASYYRQPRTSWRTLRLTDDAVIGLVNTRFLSDYYRMPADQVIRLRTGGRDYVSLAREFHRPDRHGAIRRWTRQARQERREERRERVIEQRQDLRQQRNVLEVREQAAQQREARQRQRAGELRQQQIRQNRQQINLQERRENVQEQRQNVRERRENVQEQRQQVRQRAQVAEQRQQVNRPRTQANRQRAEGNRERAQERRQANRAAKEQRKAERQEKRDN